MKTLFYTCIFLLATSFATNAQSKNLQLKQQYNFMLQMRQHQNQKSSTQNFGLKVNPYWQNIDAPHTYNSYVPQVKVPSYGVVWAHIEYDSTDYDANQFLRTADNGKTWKQDSVDTPAPYGLSGLFAVDANTCYAAMYDPTDGLGGGVFKTTDGGDTWKQVNPGKLFNENSFPDFVFFFDARNGLAVGDNNGDTTRLEIYTTCDAGKTWQRVPDKNIPASPGSVYSLIFNGYTVYKNRFWFKTYDTQGNLSIYRSDDLGHHWKSFPFNVPEFGFDFAFTDKQNGLAVGFPFDGNQSFEAVTHDGGETWTQKTDFTGYVMGGFITVIPGTHTYVSTLPGYTPIYGSSYSRDGGKSWILIDSGANALHSAVAFLNPLYGWTGRAETYTDDPTGGMFKWKYHFSLDDKAVATNENNLSAEKINAGNPKLTLYPNPAKDVIRIDGLNASGKTTLSLYNISGRLIQQFNTTSASHTISLQKLAAGNYYVTIQSNAQTATLKFVKE